MAHYQARWRRQLYTGEHEMVIGVAAVWQREAELPEVAAAVGTGSVVVRAAQTIDRDGREGGDDAFGPNLNRGSPRALLAIRHGKRQQQEAAQESIRHV